LRADLAWRAGNSDANVIEQGLWRADVAVSRKLSARPGDDDSDRLAAAAGVLQSRSNTTYVSPRVIARLYSLASETDKAIDILLQAIDTADLMQPDLIMMMPAFEATRRHPRFSEVRERLELPGAHR
jgi:hypothetical protein